MQFKSFLNPESYRPRKIIRLRTRFKTLVCEVRLLIDRKFVIKKRIVINPKFYNAKSVHLFVIVFGNDRLEAKVTDFVRLRIDRGQSRSE